MRRSAFPLSRTSMVADAKLNQTRLRIILTWAFCRFSPLQRRENQKGIIRPMECIRLVRSRSFICVISCVIKISLSDSIRLHCKLLPAPTDQVRMWYDPDMNCAFVKLRKIRDCQCNRTVSGSTGENNWTNSKCPIIHSKRREVHNSLPTWSSSDLVRFSMFRLDLLNWHWP